MRDYDKLLEDDREFVDELFRRIFAQRRENASWKKIPLHGDDKAERAVDAIARWILDGREKEKRD